MKNAGWLAALAVLGVASTASAQTQVLPWPTQADINTFLQNTQTQIQAQAQMCEPIEVAPGVKVPIPCMTNLPKPPVDAQDASLPIPAFAPAAIDLRQQNLVGPVKDQAQVGVCWSFAISSLLDNSLRRQGRGDVIAPLHVIAADGWNGIWRDGTEPLTTEIAWPYVPRKACEMTDTSDDCGSTYGVRAGSWKQDPVLVGELARARSMAVARAGKAKALKGDMVGQIVSALVSGRAVYASVGIDSRAWDYRGAQNGVLQPYGGETRGGHAVTLIGYRTSVTGRQFLIQNSWGKGWGEGGYVWMTEPELRRHMHDAFIIDATPVGFVAPVTPVPAPQPQITFPAIQRCPSGLPAVLGQCWLG
jgi:hypothetical protein